MFKKFFTVPALAGRVGDRAHPGRGIVGSFDTRTWPVRFLNLFRVQQVVVVPVDLTGMQQLTGNRRLVNRSAT